MIGILLFFNFFGILSCSCFLPSIWSPILSSLFVAFVVAVFVMLVEFNVRCLEVWVLVCSCVHEFVWWSWSCSCSRSCLVCSSARLVHGVCVGVVFAVFVMVSCTCRWCIRVIVLCLWFNIPKLVCSWVHCVRGSSACVPIVRVWRARAFVCLCLCSWCALMKIVKRFRKRKLKELMKMKLSKGSIVW